MSSPNNHPQSQTQQMMIHVLVLGRGVYALPLLRILGAQRSSNSNSNNNTNEIHVTFGTSVGITDIPSMSNHVDAVLKIPRPDYDLRAFEAAIVEYCRNKSNVVILPVAEESIFLSQVADNIKQKSDCNNPQILVSSPELLMDLNEKFQFQKRVANIFGANKTPRTTLVHDKEHLMKALRECLHLNPAAPFVVMKPLIGHGGLGTHIVRRDELLESLSETEFLQKVQYTGTTTPYVVQEYVEGKEFSTYSFCRDGVVLAHVCYIPRQVSTHGFSPIRSMAPIAQWKSTLAWVQQFAAALKLTGHFGFDVMERYNGEIVALECNPRVTNGIAFFAPRFSTDIAQQMQQVYLSCGVSKGVIAPVYQNPPHIMTTVPALSCIAKAKNASEKLALAEGFVESRDDIWWWSDPLPFVSTFVRLITTLVIAVFKVLTGQGENVTAVIKQMIVKEIIEFNHITDDSKNVMTETIGGLQLSFTEDNNNNNKKKKNKGELKVLVTGATGFLGGRIVKILNEGFDDKSIPLPPVMKHVTQITATGRNEKLGQALIDSLDSSTTGKKVQFVKADLSDAGETFRLVQGHDIVIHSAALCALWTRWEDYIAANTTAAQNIVHACHLTGVQMLVHVSSPSLCVAVDTGDRVNAVESDPVPSDEKQPNRYAATKKMAEEIVLDVTKRYNLPCVILRPRAIFGPGDTTLFPIIVDRLSKNKLPIIGGKNCIGDFTYVDNVVNACLCAMDKTPTNTKIYSITNGDPRKLWDVIDRIVETMNFKSPWKRIPIWVAYSAASVFEFASVVLLLFGIKKDPLLTRYSVNVLSRSSTFDISAAKKDLGYKPVVSFDDGVQKFLDSVS